MPQPLDILFQKILALASFAPALKSDSNPFGVDPGNVLSKDRATEATQAIPRTASGYPRVIIEPIGGSQGQGHQRTFGMSDPNFSPSTHCDGVVPVNVQVRITVVHRNKSYPQQAPLEAAIDRFLETLRPNFAQSAFGIASYNWTTSRRDESSTLTENQSRTVSRRTINVMCRPYQSYLRS